MKKYGDIGRNITTLKFSIIYIFEISTQRSTNYPSKLCIFLLRWVVVRGGCGPVWGPDVLCQVESADGEAARHRDGWQWRSDSGHTAHRHQYSSGKRWLHRSTGIYMYGYVIFGKTLQESYSYFSFSLLFQGEMYRAKNHILPGDHILPFISFFYANEILIFFYPFASKKYSLRFSPAHRKI